MSVKNERHQNNMDRIKARKQERERQDRLRIAAVFVVFLVIVILFVSFVNFVINLIKSNKKLPKPEPVNLMSYNETLKKDLKNENFVYTEPIKRPIKHENGVTDRLESVESAKAETKLCYLTFDDGPNNSITPQVLDVLRKYDIKATFFIVGTLLESNPDMARRIYEEGHLLANHSYSHNYKTIYAGVNEFMSEIEKTEELIKQTVDFESDYFPLIRFPGGSYYAGTYKDAKKMIKEHLSSRGFYYCDWNSLNGDAEGAKKNANGLFEYFKKKTDLDENIVVLMHDTVNKQATVDSLPQIIEYLKENGYTFLRLDEDF